MRRRAALLLAAGICVAAAVLGIWRLGFGGSSSPVTIHVFALPPRSASECRRLLPSWPAACRHEVRWYHLDLHTNGNRPVLVECTAILLDRHGRPIVGSRGDSRWGLLLDPQSGPFGGTAREVYPGHDVHADYPVTPGVPLRVAAFRAPSCHAIRASERPL